MLIILEGCDGAGKSTVAKKLADILNAEIIHCSMFSNNDKEFFEKIIDASCNRNIIADRFMYGQFVYQAKEERKLQFTDLYDLETKLLQSGATVVNVVAGKYEIKDRLSLRGETLINNMTVEEVCSKFKVLFKNSILPVKVWNTTEGGR